MPPKKTKAKLTPEERKEKRLEQIRNRMEKKMQKRRQLAHSVLQKEIEYTNLSVRKHEKAWKQMLVKITLPRMRAETEHVWQNFERILDVKDFTISLHLDELQFAEVQLMNSFSAHLETMNNKIRMLTDSIDKCHSQYQIELTDLQTKAKENAEILQSNFSKDEEFFKMILYGLIQIRKQCSKDFKGDFVTKVDEIKSKNVEILFNVNTDLEDVFRKYWIETKEFLTEYEETISIRRQEYHKLYHRDQNIKIANAAKMDKIKLMQFVLKRLKEKHDIQQTKQQQQIKDLKLQREYLKSAFLELRKLMMRESAKYDRALTNIAQTTNKFLNYLLKYEKKGEHLLYMMSICGKLETEEEKILCFPLTQPCKVDKNEVGSHKLLKQAERTNIGMKNFWAKVAKVDCQKYSFCEEIIHLKIENEILKGKLHDYCKCLDCPTLPPIVSRRNRVFNINEGVQLMKKYIPFNKQIYE